MRFAWRREVLRAAVIASLAAALVAIAIVIMRSGGGYTIHAHFLDAGQLVEGNEVQVGGVPIGTVSDLVLTDDNLADVVLDLDEGEFTPLRQGTTARIRTVSLSGVANRFVELVPGPSDAAEIPDGGTLSTANTQGIVDLDQLLNSFDPKTRNNLRRFIRAGAGLFEGSAPEANQTFAYLDPAFSQASAFNREIVRDAAAFARLIRSGGTVSSALASRSGDLEQGIVNAATTVRAIAAERDHLADVLAQTPGVLTRASGTLRTLRGTLSVLRPAIREARPAADPLARVLERLGPTSLAAVPVVADVRELLPPVSRTLEELPALARSALPALRASAASLRRAQPIFAGIRPYTPDFIAGLFSALGAGTGGYYDANGHFLRTKLAIPDVSGAIASLLGNLGRKTIRRGLDARCPGAAVPSAADSSNPWLLPSLCDPEDRWR